MGSGAYTNSHTVVLEAISSGVKRPGREAELSALTSVELKEMWICMSTLSYVFMVKCLIC
jgi:hypothetical protein